MRQRVGLFLSIAIPLLLIGGAVWAQDQTLLKQRIQSRAQAVASLLQSGLVREGPNGFLDSVGQLSDHQRQTVDEENKDRQTVFELIASKANETPEQVARLYAARAQKLNSQALPIPPPPIAQSCDDKQIASSIKDLYVHDAGLKNETIQVDVASGIVTLSGTVTSDLVRTSAGKDAGNVQCVKSIINNLSIGAAPTDAQIVSAIKRTFAKDSTLRAQHIQVDASHGVVTLSGSVSSDLVRTAAASGANDVTGVRTVINNLSVGTISETPVEGGSTHKERDDLSGMWVGTYTTCAGGQTNIRMRITPQTSQDIVTAVVEITVPNDTPGTFTAFGSLNRLTGFLTLQFNRWQHQPAGYSMGNIGGYIGYVNLRAKTFSGKVEQPGCGNINVQRQ